MLRVLLAAPLVVAVAAAAACGPACRDVEIQQIDLRCDEGAPFSGEIHVDSAAAFDTFVGQQCMPELPPEDVDAIVSSVDFDTRAVFVAKGPNAASELRCIAEREAERAQVCDDGLKVYFRDRYAAGGDGDCLGSWTAAFTMARADLRAVLSVE